MKEWEDFLSLLNRELGPEIVQKWVPKLIRFDAANIYLEPKDSFQISWFEEHVRPRLEGFLNSNNRPIKVHLLIEKKKPEIKQESPIHFYPDPIDSQMTFANFVPTEKNQVVFQLLQDAFSFNPIYIHGPKGCGKTHLLMAAALTFQTQKKKVLYIKAQSFTDHVVHAIRLGQMQQFRKTYREIDALIIDDIHIFSKKTATQEEFFHTFNTLHTAGKPILISANCSPALLREIEPRLISRFEWGIALEVGKSDALSVLSKKAALWKISLSDEMKTWLVEQFPNDPIMPFQALCLRAKGMNLTEAVAEKVLKDFLQKEKENLLTPEKIIKTIAGQYGITAEDILGKSQMRSAALPRQIAMFLCREKLKLPYQKIGEIFDRDHSTVMSSIKLVQKGIEEKKIDISEGKRD